MANSEGVLCGAGFETPAEALYLGKKLMVIPMKRQYEQACNAAALKEMGVAVLDKLNGNSINKIQSWLFLDDRIHVNYPDISDEILSHIIEKYMACQKVLNYSSLF